MKKTEELIIQLRKQGQVTPWWRKNYKLFELAAEKLEQLREDLSTNNEFFSGQLKKGLDANKELKSEIRRLKKDLAAVQYKRNNHDS